MPDKDKPPPLPVAADRLAISNRLSMLFAERSSLIKKLVPQAPTPRDPSRGTRARPVVDDNDNDNDMLAAPANQGVGYVSESTAARDTTREAQMLRGRMLGKRKAGASEARSRVEESESDEDEGRASLGRRKRPTTPRQVVDVDGHGGDEPAEAGDGTGVQGRAVQAQTSPVTGAQEGALQMHDHRPKKKRRKGKGKGKNRGKGGRE